MGTARTRANNKWNAKAYDRYSLMLKKGTREQLREIAESNGFSLNGYIKHLIQQDSGLDL